MQVYDENTLILEINLLPTLQVHLASIQGLAQS